MDEIKVSVILNSHNHEKYIKKALDSVVSQKTNFSFEILVHDDASSDNTAEIIKEYETKYPELIKPIYDKENQYSKHDFSLAKIQYSRVKGKYFAYLDADDYWIDNHKLQKQYDILEKNPNIDICATSAYVESKGEIIGRIAPSTQDCVFSLREVVEGDGAFVHSCSLMLRSSLLQNAPSFFYIVDIDYTMQIAGSLKGGMYYISDYTSVYRFETETSYTVRANNDSSFSIFIKKKIIEMLISFNEYTSCVYSDSVNDRLNRYNFDIALLEDNYSSIIHNYKKQFLESNTKTKIKVLIGLVSPKLINAIRKIKKRCFINN